MKKGQVTIFIILGIVILGGVMLFYLNKSKVSDFNLDSNNFVDSQNNKIIVKNYVQECLEKTSILGMYLLSSKGGQIYSYDNMLLTDHGEISYATKYDSNYYQFSDDFLSGYEAEYEGLYYEDVSLSKEFMANELDMFIEKTIPLCLRKMDIYNLEFDLDNINSISNFNINDVSISLDMPVKIIQKDKVTILNEYKMKIPFRMKKVIDVRDEIIKMILVGELKFETLTSMDLKVNILPYDGVNTIYSIYDEKSGVETNPFIFRFATQAKFNVEPKLEFIPDFVVNKGELFTYTCEAIDVDKTEIKFTSTNHLVEINQKGIITFMPVNLGIVNTTICATDFGGAKDCEIVRFKVKA